MRPRGLYLLLALSLWAGLAAAAKRPDVVNAKLETRAVTTSLETEFRALLERIPGPAWIGYAVPLVPGDRRMCCYDCEREGGHSGVVVRGCKLEGEGSSNIRSGEPGWVELEGPKQMWILFRVAQARVLRIRVFSDDCKLDAGGLPLYWLTGVRPEQSVALLSGFVRGTTRKADEDEIEDHMTEEALAAIALTEDPAADRAFDRFVAADEPPSVRAHATFWLGEARGRHGLELLQRMVQEDPSERVRERAVFGLSISKQPESLPSLIEVAHRGSPGVRGQALFWLAQKAGKKAAEAITTAIEQDPETEVKKRAVFALSQLPPDEGVPLLIKVTRTNRNPEVRRQAMFWLGQSTDPRALAFIEDILTH